MQMCSAAFWQIVLCNVVKLKPGPAAFREPGPVPSEGRAPVRPRRVNHGPAISGEQSALPVHQRLDELGDSGNAAKGAQALVVDGIIGAPDRDGREYGNELRMLARNEGMQDADACPGPYRLHLAERRGNRKTRLEITRDLVGIGQ